VSGTTPMSAAVSTAARWRWYRMEDLPCPRSITVVSGAASPLLRVFAWPSAGEGAPADSAGDWATKRTHKRKKNKRQKSQNARAR
jgi:hypothetical protein